MGSLEVVRIVFALVSGVCGLWLALVSVALSQGLMVLDAPRGLAVLARWVTAVAAVTGGATVAVIGDVQPHIWAQGLAYISLGLGSYATTAYSRAARGVLDDGERRALRRMVYFGLAAVAQGLLGLISTFLLV